MNAPKRPTVRYLRGHTLPNEGRIYADSYRITEVPAVCSCGDESGLLKSDNARRAWHREHKAQKATAGRDV